MTTPGSPVIGVLALQGDVREHLIALAAADAVARPVRRPDELAEVDGLVIPGGEITGCTASLWTWCARPGDLIPVGSLANAAGMGYAKETGRCPATLNGLRRSTRRP